MAGAQASETLRPTAERTFGWRLRRSVARAPLHLVLIAVMVLWSVPTIALLVSSFRDPIDIASNGWWNWFKNLFDVTWSNYDTVINQQGMGRAFVNSLIITVPSTALVILVAASAAYAFARMEFPFRDTL